MSRCVLVAAVLVLLGSPVAAQSRSQGLVATARSYMSARQFDRADQTLTDALQAALYEQDSVDVFVWRGILAYLRGNDSLTRVNFRQVVALHQVQLSGLEKISPDLADIFEDEARPHRVYADSELQQRAAWVSGPKLAYPASLQQSRLAGHALVRFVVDSLGQAESMGMMVLESPDSAFDEPLKQMVLAAHYSPAQRKGHAVRSIVALGFDLHPPAPENPTRLIAAAREQLRVRHTDSAIALTDAALDPYNQATAGERVYAQLVRGMALGAAHRDSLAAVALDAGLAGYRDLTARGVDLAPFLKRLADSLRVSRRPKSPESPFAAPTAVDAVEAQPALVTHPAIRYAPEMQALRIGGTVVVEATLDTTGHVLPASARVVQSPNPVFDVEAKRVVTASVYRPARVHGKPARVTIRQAITFAAY